MIDQLQRMKVYKDLNPNELCPQQFLNLEKEIKNPSSNLISDEYVDFKLWQLGLLSRQEKFAKYIAKKLPRNDSRILEVGCGRTARVSRILKGAGFSVTGIDPKVEKSSCGNVEVIRDKFHFQKFDLSGYGFVIAQEPCDATEHVIRACIAHRIPFIMSLCGVPHKMISGYMPKDEKEWYKKLISISEKDLRLYYIELDPLTITPMLRTNF